MASWAAPVSFVCLGEIFSLSLLSLSLSIYKKILFICLCCCCGDFPPVCSEGRSASQDNRASGGIYTDGAHALVSIFRLLGFVSLLFVLLSIFLAIHRVGRIVRLCLFRLLSETHIRTIDCNSAALGHSHKLSKLQSAWALVYVVRDVSVFLFFAVSLLFL